MDSILLTIKQLLGIAADDTVFDRELIIHINSAIAILTQLGVGSETGFRITGDTELWESWMGSKQDIEDVKTDIYLRCRLSFDPPQNSFLVKSFEDQIKELEWRIEVATSPIV